MQPVVKIRNCPTCGSDKLTSVLLRPLEDYLEKRNSYYNLSSLSLSGKEIMGYARCRNCGFTFASPTLDEALEEATYNEAKGGQNNDVDWRKSKDGIALYQTHHKWVDLNPFVIGLGFKFDRYQKPYIPGQVGVRLLDIGCGFGHTLELARVFGIDGVGCDLDRHRLSVCHDKGLIARKPEEVEGAFDVVISSNVIEHVYNLNDYMAMVTNHLADDGVFVFSGLEKSVIPIELKRKRFKLVHPIEHRNIMTRQSLKYLLDRNGLRLVSRGELLSVMRKVRSKAPLYLPFFLAAGFVAIKGVFSAIAKGK